MTEQKSPAKQLLLALLAIAAGVWGLNSALDAVEASVDDQTFDEVVGTIESGVARQIYRSTFDTAECAVDRELFTRVNEAQYVAVVQCASEYSSYASLVQITKFGPDQYHWATDGLQENKQ